MNIRTSKRTLNLPLIRKYRVIWRQSAAWIDDKKEYIHAFFYGTEDMFGRKDIMLLTGLKATRASEVIKLLTSAEIIEAVKGHGKGKYCFIKELNGRPTYKESM